MTQRKDMRIRLRVYRQERVPDNHGGTRQVWQEGEERWGRLCLLERFLPSSDAIEGTEAGTLPKKRMLYCLKMRVDPMRRPFERFSWKGIFYAVLSEEVTPASSGYDFFWVSRAQKGEEHE